MTDRLKTIEKALKALPKDRSAEPSGGQGMYAEEEWRAIDAAYKNGTRLVTIFAALPEPKSKSYKSFKESYRRWRGKQAKHANGSATGVA